jgi:hypothetical protein
MNTTNTGGPAFPAGERYELKEGWRLEEGMTLRDYFAAKALQGMMASRSPNSPRFHPEDDAAYVYAVADAMLKERGI